MLSCRLKLCGVMLDKGRGGEGRGEDWVGRDQCAFLCCVDDMVALY